MKSICTTMFLILFLTGNLLTAHFAATSKTRAFLTNIKGTVKIKSRGKPEEKATKAEALLFGGDIIKIDEDGEALLWQAYNEIVRLKPGTSTTIPIPPPPSGSDILSFSDYLKCETRILESMRDTKRESPRTQGGDDKPYFVALSPRYSLALSSRPTFEWTPVKQATSYDFTLRDSNEKLIWSKNTRETHLIYPDHKQDESATELKPEEYLWEVFANLERNVKKQASAKFTIVTAEEAGRIQAALSNARKLMTEPTATNLVYVALCFEHQQYPEAEKALKAALLNHPDDLLLKALLMDAYEKMKRPEEREDLREAFINLDIIEVGRQFRIAELLRDKK